MGTKGATGAGIQHTQRGPVQGVHLVGPSGEPISAVLDGSGNLRLAVDADVNIENATINVDLDTSTDGVHIGNSGNNDELLINSDGSISIRLLDESGSAFSDANPLPVAIPAGLDVNIEIDATDGDTVAVSGHISQVFTEALTAVTTTGFTTILSFTPAANNTNIKMLEITGPVDALARVRLNGTEIRRKYINAQNPSVSFQFKEPRRINMVDTIDIQVQPGKAIPGFMAGGADFFASLQGFVD